MKKTPPPGDLLRCGLLGAGSFFRYAYLPALNHPSSPLALTGILARDAGKFREVQRSLRHTAAPFTDADSLFNSGIQAALILLPNRLHFESVRSALKRGLDVFCEKPLTNTVADALALKTLAEFSKRIVMVDFNQRYSRRNKLLHQAITENRVGKTTSVHAFHNQDLRGLKSFAALHRDLTGGGVVHNAGIHFINLFLHWFGMPERVHAVFENRALPAECGEDTAHCRFWFPSGITATLDASLAGAVDTTYERIQITGERGEISSDFKKCSIALKAHNTPPTRIPCPAEIVSDTVFHALEHFARCVREKCPPETDIDDFIKTLKVVEALTMSARRGTEASLKEIEEKYVS